MNNFTNFTKSDLRTGDIVLRANNRTEIVNLELGTLINQKNWSDLDKIRDDLTCIYGKEFDIVAVRRPTEKYHCRFDAFEQKRGVLVYDRKSCIYEETQNV